MAVTETAQERATRIEQYCAGFVAYRRALIEAVERGDDPRVSGGLITEVHQMIVALNSVELPIRKSNLLYRLVYLGEQLRTEKCPKHKGRWSGYHWEFDCDCQRYEAGGWGLDVTGWLPVGFQATAADFPPESTGNQPEPSGEGPNPK